MVAEEQSLLLIVLAAVQVYFAIETAVQGYFAGERAETLTLFRYAVGKYLLQDILDYDQKQKNKSFIKETIMLTVKLKS